MQPLVAIVGSANLTRTSFPYEPELKNTDDVKRACLELGHELANKGYRIMVYTSSSKYIEADVVEGYVSSGKAVPGSIQIRYPNLVDAAPGFKEMKAHRNLFDDRRDRHSNWQVSFYNSLRDAQGILLLGGGNSALITGLIALMYRIPLVSIATFGGSAETVWQISADRLATDEESQVMSRPRWEEDSARRLIEILGDQSDRLREKEKQQRAAAQQTAQQEEQRRAEAQQREERRRAEEERRKVEEERRRRREMFWRAACATLLLLAATAAALLGIYRPAAGNTMFYGATFFLTPILAGAVGGVAVDLFDFYNSGDYKPNHAIFSGIVLGAIAGFFSAILFAASQWASTPAKEGAADGAQALPPATPLLIIFVMLIGFTAGVALDKVFLKWKEEGPYRPPAAPPGPVGRDGGGGGER
jgi:hypothetical protein